MTSSIAATGNYELPLQLTAELVAASSSFRTAIGAANATAAKDSIFIRESAPQDRWPRVIIDWGERDWTLAGRTVYTLTGEVIVLFQWAADRAEYQANRQDVGREFGNIISGMEGDWLTLMRSNPGLYPDLQGITGPQVDCPDPDETDCPDPDEDSEDEYVFSAIWALRVKGTG